MSEVTQADHVQAAEIMRLFELLGTKMTGADDYQALLRELSAHRIAAYAAGKADERERIAKLVKAMMYGDIAHDAETQCHDDVLQQIIAAIAAAEGK